MPELSRRDKILLRNLRTQGSLSREHARAIRLQWQRSPRRTWIPPFIYLWALQFTLCLCTAFVLWIDPSPETTPHSVRAVLLRFCMLTLFFRSIVHLNFYHRINVADPKIRPSALIDRVDLEILSLTKYFMTSSDTVKATADLLMWAVLLSGLLFAERSLVLLTVMSIFVIEGLGPPRRYMHQKKLDAWEDSKQEATLASTS